jgi:hypothetical protein
MSPENLGRNGASPKQSFLSLGLVRQCIARRVANDGWV